MSQENVETVRRMAEALNSEGVDAIRRSSTHSRVARGTELSESSVYRGIEAVSACTEQFVFEFTGMRFEVAELVDAGEHVLATMG